MWEQFDVFEVIEAMAHRSLKWLAYLFFNLIKIEAYAW